RRDEHVAEHGAADKLIGTKDQTCYRRARGRTVGQRRLLANRVRACGKSVKLVCAARVSGGCAIAGIQLAIAVDVEIDDGPAQARFARVSASVVVGILEDASPYGRPGK